jgi:hypothetical protein
MMRSRPVQLILIGFVLVLLGWVFPLLMVLRVVPSSFLLNFFSYGASISGLFLGIIGASMYVRLNKKNKK